MKNIFTSFSSESIVDALRSVFRRFLEPTVLILVISGLLFMLVATESDDILLPKLIITGVVTFFLSLCVSLFLETRKVKPLDARFPLLPLVYGVFFFLTVRITHDFSVEGFVYAVLHFVGFFAGVFFAPYVLGLFDGKDESIEYTNYFSRVAWVFLMSAIVGGSLLALGFIAISSVLALFDLYSSLSDFKIYANWAIVSLALVAPLYGLIHMPKKGDMSTRSYETNRFFSFLIRYVAVPAIYVYFAILYAYSLKVLMNFQDWPKGMISWMVIGFSSFGYLAYIFSKPYEDTRFVAVFRRYFPYAVIPQIGMLAYAISLRIGQYDLTMNRYFVVIFGAWLLIVSFYLIFRARKSLAFIVASLSVISLLVSIGPWSVFSLPFSRQEARLIRNLTEAKILQNGKIVPLAKASDISRNLSNEIAEGISYLCDYDNCERIKTIFPDQVKIAEKNAYENWKSWNTVTGATYSGTVSRWDVESVIMTDIHVERSYGYAGEKVEPTFFYSTTESLYPIDTRGYRSMIAINPYEYKSQTEKKVYPYISYDSEKNTFIYQKDENNIIPLTVVMPPKFRDGTSPRTLTKNELTFDAVGK